MRTFVQLSLALSLLFAGNAAGAESEYYPLKKGHHWEYKCGDDTLTIRVAELNDQGARLEVLVKGKAEATETMLVKDDGIYKTQAGADEVKPPVKVFELKNGKPSAKGSTWKIDSKFGSKEVTGSYEVADDKAKVKVPAGEFETVLVKGEFESKGVKFSTSYWVAAKTGVVKFALVDPTNELVFELNEFRPAKDEPAKEEPKEEAPKKEDAPKKEPAKVEKPKDE